jgi:hypothetical protein
MFRKLVASAIVVIAILALSGYAYLKSPHSWLTDRSHDHPVLFVANGFDDHTHKYLMASGQGWFATETLDILAIGVPQRDADGQIVSSTTWSKIGTQITNGSGTLGAPPVRIQVTPFCGFPPPGLQNPTFKAQDTKLAMVATSTGDTQAWFTFEACGQ